MCIIFTLPKVPHYQVPPQTGTLLPHKPTHVLLFVCHPNYHPTLFIALVYRIAQNSFIWVSSIHLVILTAVANQAKDPTTSH